VRSGLPNPLERDMLFVFLLLASIGIQKCHSFKQIRRKFTPQISKYCQLRNSAVKPLLFSIRGGDDHEGEDFDDYDESAQRFIASFEAQLVEIRRDAEQDAENEIRKLRELMGKEDVDEDDTDHDYYEHGDGSSDIDEPEAETPIDCDENGPTEKNDDIRGDILDVSPKKATEATGQSKDESDDVLSGVESTGASSQPNDESSVENDRNEEVPIVDEDEGIPHHLDSDLPNHLNHDTPSRAGEVSDVDESGVKSMNSGTAVDEFNKDSTRGVGKSPKAKKRKLKKKRKKAKEQVPEEGQVDVGETVMLTRIQDESQSGIWFYLRSDLGRALCLFVATVLLSILTQRLQRQMEVEMVV